MRLPNEQPAIPLDQTCQWEGISLHYPSVWELDASDDAGHRSITITTDNTAFWMMSLIQEPISVDQILDSALATFQEEYEEVDIYEQTWDEQRHWISQELDLVYQDLITSVVLKVLVLDEAALFVLYQGQDQELDQQRSVFNAITESIRLDPDLLA